MEKTKEQIIAENKKLIEEFPFLLPHNRWTDKVLEDYDYSYTELDAMPTAWREKFGLDMCRELKDELVKFNFLDDYRIVQIKEKWGELRWYDNGHPIGSKISEIITKYECLSTCYCINCGKPVRYRTAGWVEYLCEDCKKKYIDGGGSEEHFVRLTEDDIPYICKYENGVSVEKEIDCVDFRKLWGIEK